MAILEADDQRLRYQRPPYVAFTAFEQFLRTASSEEIPPRVDAACLGRWGVAGGNESALVTSLKALGLIDAEARPTSDYGEVRLSIPRRNTSLRQCARRAYAGLPGPIANPIDGDRLRDYFIASRGLRGQMVDKAVRFYRQLEVMLSNGQPTVDPEESSGNKARELKAFVVDTPGLHVCVQIPFDANEADLVSFFKRLKRAWDQAGDADGD